MRCGARTHCVPHPHSWNASSAHGGAIATLAVSFVRVGSLSGLPTSTLVPIPYGSKSGFPQYFNFTNMSARATTYVGCVIAAGSLAAYPALAHWECADPLRFATYLLLALVAGALKVRLPGMTGTFSLNFLLVLIGIGS